MSILQQIAQSVVSRAVQRQPSFNAEAYATRSIQSGNVGATALARIMKKRMVTPRATNTSPVTGRLMGG